MIDNFAVMDEFLEFTPGTFYKFELLTRNTDGENILYREDFPNNKKCILIKSWYIDSVKYYKDMKHEMITLANLTGARLYVTLDQKDICKVIYNTQKELADLMIRKIQGTEPNIRNVSKIIGSQSSKIDNSVHSNRTLMFDIDTKEQSILTTVIHYIESNGQKPYILKTRKGYHVFCYKKFNSKEWLQDLIQIHFNDVNFGGKVPFDEYKKIYEMKFAEVVSLNPNQLGLVYHPEIN